jgi:hypothetical protein
MFKKNWKPVGVEAKVMPASAEHIPSIAELSVSPATAKKLGIRKRRRCDMTVGTESYPVFVRRSFLTSDDQDVARVRVPLVVRLIANAPLKQVVTLTRIPRRTPKEWWSDVKGRVRMSQSRPHYTRMTRLFVAVTGLTQLTLRRLHFLLELILRAFLGAPTFSFKSEKAYPGDDPLDVIRVHPTVSEALGVSPGTHVLLTWRGRSTLVRLLDDFSADGMQNLANRLNRVGSVHKVDEEIDQLPSTLVVHIGSRVRAQLGMPTERMPTETIVEIRRSVSSAVAKQLSSFLLPLVAVVFSAVGLPDNEYRWVIAATVGVIGVILALASVRVSRSSHGLWP